MGRSQFIAQKSADPFKLASLRLVAEALDCALVYALIPNKPLEAIVRERAPRGTN